MLTSFTPFTSDSKAVRREGQQREEIIYRSSKWCPESLRNPCWTTGHPPHPPPSSGGRKSGFWFPLQAAHRHLGWHLAPQGLQNAVKGRGPADSPSSLATRSTFQPWSSHDGFQTVRMWTEKLSHTCSAICLGSFITVFSTFRADFKRISKYPEREPPKGGGFFLICKHHVN